ncbi:zinc-binding alcohol dehydrogenase family protein [Streptomyces sp. BK340]|uniref:quinone oxidoreductase family protein n=1 Tax=Streptomyces sp. BK340 TaxID=2572903 RepID=UPI0011A8F944|nr:zinc-binding alcohol dehydrogenase family protein [Streptomyces sp. BK340]TVZ90407.1 NADPH2:quinone reductase [Streptomyces sp. BK340]
MHAIRHHRFGDPDVLRWEQMPTPEPSPGEVLLRVEAAAVNRYDLLSRAGINPKLPLPRIVGIDCTGTVEHYDGPRTDLAPGTSVVVLGDRLGNGGPGAYATHVCVTADEVFPLPPDTCDITAACLGIPYITAYYALFQRHHIRPGETLLVPGAGGGVATAAIQLAHHAGIRVLATSHGPARCNRARRLGADECFDYRADDIPAQVRKATDGRGVDVVLNAVGGDTIAQGLQCLRDRGRLLAIGSAQGRQFAFDGFRFLLREQQVIGVNVTPLTPTRRFAIFQKLLALIQASHITVPIDHFQPMAQAAEAHRRIESGAALGKTVLIPPPAS